MRKMLVVVVLVAAWLVSGAVPASAAQPSWDGQYSLKRFAASKYGTSLAARQGEPDFSDVYTFTTECRSGTPCVSTVSGGPAPKNPTLPQPARYVFNGTSWVHVYDWQWDCYQGPDRAKVWAPARSVATYTKQADGSYTGVWRTDIDGGPCDGYVEMRVAAYPVDQTPVRFGS